ncbi:hypothetical protein PRNP1_012951 [Phytophthora ramorum]
MSMLATSSTIAVIGATTLVDNVLALELADAADAEVSLPMALALALVVSLPAEAELDVSVGMVTVGSVLLELLPLLAVDAMVTVASLALDAVDAGLVVGLVVVSSELVLALDAVVAELALETVEVVALGDVVVATLALDVVEVVLVLVDESLDSAAHVAENPFTISYTLMTRPLVGTVNAQSGGSSSMMAEISDWQLVDAHISAYSSSVGIVDEYMRLKPESSAHPSNELSVMTLANVEYAVVCCDEEHVAELEEPEAAAEPAKAAAAMVKTVFVFIVPCLIGRW